ncbi:MAG TPA: hypothetical protein VGX68_10580 [Thermoanaerobaculia bacterium]|jgi:hypothetical protein|nr:hypothetical protein [Thermoanaerobaculia bacterium]
MTMTPRLRKTVLTAHITFSVGWLGATAGFEALAVAGLASQKVERVRAAYLAMEPTAWFVIVPFAFASLLTGLVMSLGTRWGLFRHYWILAKFLINTLAIAILLLHTQLISYVAGAAAQQTLFSEDLRGARIQLAVIAGAAMLALLVATTLAVFKPRGMTPYGKRKQQEWRETLGGSTPDDNRTIGGGLPLGLKLFLAVLGVIVVVIIVVHLAGGGFGSHGR